LLVTFPHPQSLLAFDDISAFCKSYKKVALRSGPGTFRGSNSAVSFGVVTGLLSISDTSAVEGYLYTLVRDCVSAAVRMNVIGPLEGAGVIRSVMKEVVEAVKGKVEEGREVDWRESKGWGGVMDAIQEGHSRLYCRLFKS
jgi:urease accessory protein UreF